MHRVLPAALLFLAVAVLTGCAQPLPEADLQIPVNAKCTTCEDFIRCDAGSGNAAVYDPSFHLYQLEPKSFVAQIATVWEFLIQLVHTRTEDFRPLSIYVQGPGDGAVSRSVTDGGDARTDLVQHRIYLPDGWIDQVTGAWHEADDDVRGACRPLPAAEGRELLKLFTKTP